MKKPVEDEAFWTLIREHLELDDFSPVPSVKPPERYREISCTIPTFSTDLNRSRETTEPRARSRINWFNVAVWAGVAASSAVWVTGLIWFIQMVIQAIPI